MFKHQADAFLFNHGLLEDVPMSSLSDYAEYNHADDLDKSGVPGKLDVSHSGGHHEAYHSDGSDTNAEDILILLPLCFGWDWFLCHGHKSLAVKEAKLHYAQATDSIHQICLALGFKSAPFWTQVRHAHTQKTKS
jgi:hypothetical protein